MNESVPFPVRLLGFLPVASLAGRVPGLVPGAWFHRAGLEALESGAGARAAELLEHAACAYRHELEVEPLARARVHQMMAQALAGTLPAEERLEVERRLLRIDTIEALSAPFERVPAHDLLGRWRRLAGVDDPPPPRLRLVS